MKKFITSRAGVLLLASILIVAICVGVLVRQRQVHAQQQIWAGQIRQATGYLMLDLFHAQAGSIRDVPADGQWHGRIFFSRPHLGSIEYLVKEGRLLRVHAGKVQGIADHVDFLHVRRERNMPSILEIQLKVKKLPVINLRTRISDQYEHP